MHASQLVDLALARIESVDHWMSVPQLRALDEVKAILGAPDDVRRECVLRLAAFSMGGDRDSQARQLLPVAARKRLPPPAEDTVLLLTLAADARGTHGAYLARQLLSAVVTSIEAAAPVWSGLERERIAHLIEAAAARLTDHRLATRLRRLTTAAGDLPLELIARDDDTGPRLVAALEASSEQRDVAARLVELLGAYPTSGRPPPKWSSEADAVRAALDSPAVVTSALLDALLGARDRFMAKPNEAIACAIAALAGRLRDPGLLDRLRRLAIKSAAIVGGQFGSPRSLRLANHCAQAIADVAAPASITELLALERAVRHGSLLNQIRKAIDSLAAAQGMTGNELLERAVEDHGLEADGTRTVPLVRGHALVEVDARGAALTYVDQNGKPRKSFPADLKEAVADVRAELKGIRKTISGECHRLDS